MLIFFLVRTKPHIRMVQTLLLYQMGIDCTLLWSLDDKCGIDEVTRSDDKTDHPRDEDDYNVID